MCHFTQGRSACIQQLERDACTTGADTVYAFREGIVGEMTVIAATLALSSSASTSGGRSTSDGSSSGWSDAQVLQYLRAVNDGVVACLDGGTMRARFTLDGQGRARDVTGLEPPLTDEQRTCVDAALGASTLDGTGGPRRVTARFLPSEHAAPAAIVEPDVGDDATGTPFPDLVRERIVAATEPILACTGGTSAAILGEWETDGRVGFSVRGATDALVTECVTAAVGAVDVPSGTAAGRVLHPVSR
jgi:hypothetical protein